MSEQGGRYQRSMSGMLGALIATLLVIGAFVAFRALNRDQPDLGPESVDYRAGVAAARERGVRVVHPVELPAGWRATSIDVASGDEPRWGLGVLTDDGAFVGLRQEDAPTDELVETYVDEQAAEGDEVELPGEVGRIWRTWRDEGGDVAYSTSVDDTTLLVYGSAPAEEIRAFVSLLTR